MENNDITEIISRIPSEKLRPYPDSWGSVMTGMVSAGSVVSVGKDK